MLTKSSAYVILSILHFFIVQNHETQCKCACNNDSLGPNKRSFYLQNKICGQCYPLLRSFNLFIIFTKNISILKVFENFFLIDKTKFSEIIYFSLHIKQNSINLQIFLLILSSSQHRFTDIKDIIVQKSF